MFKQILIVVACFGAVATVATADDIDIKKAVEQMDEGTIRITFAARDGVCGDGDHSISFDGESRHVSHGHYDDDWERDCDDGPVRVSLKVRDGEVVRVRTRVGGSWRSAGENTVDLGEVPARDAAEFMLDLVEHARESVAEDAILPVILARDVVVWPQILDVARDDDRPEDVRKSAVFWLGQLAGEKATEGLVKIIDDDDVEMEVRETAVFALSQCRGTSYEDLMVIARTNRHPQLRKQAMFWLAQNDDPEVLEFFEEILLGD